MPELRQRSAFCYDSFPYTLFYLDIITRRPTSANCLLLVFLNMQIDNIFSKLKSLAQNNKKNIIFLTEGCSDLYRWRFFSASPRSLFSFRLKARCYSFNAINFVRLVVVTLKKPCNEHVCVLVLYFPLCGITICKEMRTESFAL